MRMKQCILNGFDGVQTAKIVETYQTDEVVFYILKEKSKEYLSLYRTLADHEADDRFINRLTESLVFIKEDINTEVRVLYITLNKNVKKLRKMIKTYQKLKFE